MNKGWFELESDPGLFTLLLQDIGVKGVQVEEIYDLQKPIEGPAYGFIFLFRWIEERRSRRKTITEEETFVTDENIVNNIFFAQQMIPNSCATHALPSVLLNFVQNTENIEMIPNSCATHALLSVLLNCEKVNLGETLSKLKSYCKNMNPETKGYAIGNIPELSRAHNSHARKEPSQLPEKQQGMTIRTMEAFHFVSYVPINGRLFELDGLKPWPIDHGPWEANEDWTEKFRRVISERLGMATGGEPYHDIRYNLMAVVPDKVSLYLHKLSTLKTNRQIVLDAIQQMMKGTYPGTSDKDKQETIIPPQINLIETSTKPRLELTTPHTLSSDSEELNKTTGAACSSISSGTSASASASTSVNMVSGEKNIVVVKDETPMEVDVETFHIDGSEKVDVKTEHTVADNKIVIKIKAETSELIDSTQKSDQINLTNSEKTAEMVSDKSDPIIRSEKTISSQTAPAGSGDTDITKPLTIETKFSTSPGPSSESTDTASEVGSGFSSPGSAFDTSAQNSPSLSSGEKSNENSPLNKSDLDVSKSRTKFSSQQGFRLKDLVALLKNVDSEIKVCETKLQDEQEKIRKYKIDDCRRTHNYDPFLCTFLSMLAEQGLLAELIQQHSLIKKRIPGRIGKLTKLSQAAKKKGAKAKRRR